VGADETVTGAGDRGAGIRVSAVVLKERPALVFEVVVLDSQQKVLAHLVGNAERNFVRLVPGDRVELELSPHDPGRGKILRKVN